jgi:hypothetical protein
MAVQDALANPIGQNGQVQDGHGHKDLFFEFLVDGAVKVVFGEVGYILVICFSDLGLLGRVGRMDRGISTMVDGRIKDGANTGLVVSIWHDNGEMTVTTTTMSRVNGMGISVELMLEDLQGTVGGLGDGSKEHVGECKSWRCGSQETHGRKSKALWRYGDQQETTTEVALEERSTGGGSGRVERQDGVTLLVTTE